MQGSTSEWLSSLKVNDSYVTLVHYGYGTAASEKTIVVEKVTPQQIHLSNGDKYWKKNLQQVGGHSYKTMPLPATEEELERNRKYIRKNAIANALSEVKWRSLSLDDLEKITEIVNQHKQTAM